MSAGAPPERITVNIAHDNSLRGYADREVNKPVALRKFEYAPLMVFAAIFTKSEWFNANSNNCFWIGNETLKAGRYEVNEHMDSKGVSAGLWGNVLRHQRIRIPEDINGPAVVSLVGSGEYRGANIYSVEKVRFARAVYIPSGLLYFGDITQPHQ